MDTLWLWRLGFVLIWTIFACVSLWLARREDAKYRQRRSRVH
jgi:hypothetical protein